MIRKSRIRLVIAAFFAIALLAVAVILSDKNKTIPSPPDAKEYSRIISLAPSTTEILYCLGLGEKVIGVSQYSDYPPQAAKKPQFGGLMNINYEAIVAARADVVIVFPEMLEPENKFKILGINTIVAKHNTIDDILDSILLIGQKCGAEKRAAEVVANLQAKMRQAERRRPADKNPKVLVCIGHSISSDPDRMLDDIYIAGNDGFYDKMLEIAGAKNAYSGRVAFPKVSYESLIAMNPDIIIDIMYDTQKACVSNDIVLKQWQKFSDVRAVRDNKVYILGEKYMAIPGPRFILTLEKIANVISKDADSAN